MQYGDEEDLEEFYLRTTKQVPTGNMIEDRWHYPRYGESKRMIAEMKTVDRDDIPPYELEKREAQEAISTFLGVFDDDDMEQMFGDNQEITVTRDGVTTNVYVDY